MLVTPSEMVTVIRLLHNQKAHSPIVFTLPGILIEYKVLQPSNAHLPILVTLLGIIVFLQPEISVLSDFLMMALQLSRES